MSEIIAKTRSKEVGPSGSHKGEDCDSAGFTSGVLPSQSIREALRNGEIHTSVELDKDQIQPASLDLRLGLFAYRVRASFLPGPGRTVRERAEELSMHRIDLSEGAVLETGCVYIIPLLESLDLAANDWAIANPKSSTGRLDVFARVITDEGMGFDRIAEGYQGPLYVEIAPRTFSVLAKTGSRLVQLRLKRGEPTADDTELHALQQADGLIVGAKRGAVIREGRVAVSVDISGFREDGLIGYKAKRHAPLIDLEGVGAHDPRDYWDPVYHRNRKGLVLDPDDFYILASRESVTVPMNYAAEMTAYDTLIGEFRVHYAGFFDPGFGHAEAGGSGSRAVLEVRSHDVPFMIEDGQIVGWLVYERLLETPDILYGRDIGSNYQAQGLKLSKHFSEWD